jgi:hypothetical protein
MSFFLAPLSQRRDHPGLSVMFLGFGALAVTLPEFFPARREKSQWREVFLAPASSAQKGTFPRLASNQVIPDRARLNEMRI